MQDVVIVRVELVTESVNLAKRAVLAMIAAIIVEMVLAKQI